MLCWVSFSSLVSDGTWCNDPESCAPWRAARLNTQIVRLLGSREGADLHSVTFCPASVKEEAEREEGGPQYGSEPPPELCPDRTPSLLVKEKMEKQV